jgi:replicative DNA helicase
VNADDAERAVLGAILSGWRDIDALHLRAEDFYQPKHEAVYDAILRVRASGSRPDMVTVRMALGQHPSLRSVDTGVFLAELTEACPVTVQAPRYAAEVVAAADRRGLDVFADRVKAMVADGMTPDEITDRAKVMLNKAPRRSGSASLSWSDIDGLPSEREPEPVRLRHPHRRPRDPEPRADRRGLPTTRAARGRQAQGPPRGGRPDRP